MKNCNDMVNSLLERRDKYEQEQKRKRRMLTASVLPALCLCVVIAVGVGNIGVGQPCDTSDASASTLTDGDNKTEKPIKLDTSILDISKLSGTLTTENGMSVITIYGIVNKDNFQSDGYVVNSFYKNWRFDNFNCFYTDVKSGNIPQEFLFCWILDHNTDKILLPDINKVKDTLDTLKDGSIGEGALSYDGIEIMLTLPDGQTVALLFPKQCYDERVELAKESKDGKLQYDEYSLIIEDRKVFVQEKYENGNFLEALIIAEDTNGVCFSVGVKETLTNELLNSIVIFNR